jgi:hypothetical protein
MASNIGPWTKEVLGKSLTPQEFLASPQAQDAVFQAKFGQYAQKYGPEGAAKAWFAGEKGMNNPNAKDSLGTSVSAYANKFTGALGGQPAQSTVAPMQQAAMPQAAPQMASAQSISSPFNFAPSEQQQPQAASPDFSGLLGQQLAPHIQSRRPVNVSWLAQLLQNAPPELRGLLQG